MKFLSLPALFGIILILPMDITAADKETDAKEAPGAARLHRRLEGERHFRQGSQLNMARDRGLELALQGKRLLACRGHEAGQTF